MKTINKLSRHIENIAREHALPSRRFISFPQDNQTIWKGTRRYAH